MVRKSKIPSVELHRLAWARYRIDEFITAWDAFLAKEPYKLIPQVKRRGKFVKVDFQIQVTKLPLRHIRFRVGDAIHNLRAVVDNLVWSLGQSRGASERLGLEFHATDSSFTKMYKPKIANLPAEIKDWLVSEQPYSRTHGKSILHILNSLWNEDKHRSPVLLACAIPSPTIIASRNSIHLEMIVRSGFKDGDKIATASVPINQKIPFHDDFTFDLVFSQKGPAKGAVVRTWLMEAHKYILQEVVPKFKPFLP